MMVVIPLVDVQPGDTSTENYLLSPTYFCGTNGEKPLGKIMGKNMICLKSGYAIARLHLRRSAAPQHQFVYLGPGTFEKPYTFYKNRSEQNIELLQDPALDITEIDLLLTPEISDLARVDVSATDPLMMFIDPLLLQSLWLRLWFAAEKQMKRILDRIQHNHVLAYFPLDGNPIHGVGRPYSELRTSNPKLHEGNNTFGNSLRQMFCDLRENAVPTVLVLIDCCDSNELEIRSPKETSYQSPVLVLYLSNAYATFCIALVEALTNPFITDVLLMCGTRDKPENGLHAQGRVRMVSTLSKLGHFLLEYPNMRRFIYLGTSEVSSCIFGWK